MAWSAERSCSLAPSRQPADLELHLTSDHFSLLQVDVPESSELVEAICEHGLQQSIVLHAYRILDGRNRCRACAFATPASAALRPGTQDPA